MILIVNGFRSCIVHTYNIICMPFFSFFFFFFFYECTYNTRVVKGLCYIYGYLSNRYSLFFNSSMELRTLALAERNCFVIVFIRPVFYLLIDVIYRQRNFFLFFFFFSFFFPPHPTHQLQTPHPQYLHLSKLVSAIFLRLPRSLPPMVFLIFQQRIDPRQD